MRASDKSLQTPLRGLGTFFLKSDEYTKRRRNKDECEETISGNQFLK
jgi:hypothetical protein